MELRCCSRKRSRFWQEISQIKRHLTSKETRHDINHMIRAFCSLSHLPTHPSAPNFHQSRIVNTRRCIFETSRRGSQIKKEDIIVQLTFMVNEKKSKDPIKSWSSKPHAGQASNHNTPVTRNTGKIYSGPKTCKSPRITVLAWMQPSLLIAI